MIKKNVTTVNAYQEHPYDGLRAFEEGVCEKAFW
jgi:hypothetical protein